MKLGCARDLTDFKKWLARKEDSYGNTKLTVSKKDPTISVEKPVEIAAKFPQEPSYQRANS